MINELVHVCQKAREEARLSMTQVAAAAGKDQSQISRFENGRLGWPRDADAYLDGYSTACGLEGPHVLWERAMHRKYESYMVEDVMAIAERIGNLDSTQGEFRQKVLENISALREDMRRLTATSINTLLQTRGDHAFDALLVHYIFEHAPIGLGYVNKDCQFVRVNERLAEMNGKSVTDHIGKAVSEVVPDLWEQIAPALERARRGETVSNVEYSGNTPAMPNRHRHWRGTYLPVHEGTEGVLCIVEEITRQKLLEQLVIGVDGDGAGRRVHPGDVIEIQPPSTSE